MIFNFYYLSEDRAVQRCAHGTLRFFQRARSGGWHEIPPPSVTSLDEGDLARISRLRQPEEARL